MVHGYGKAKELLSSLDRVEQWTTFEESLFGGFARPCFMAGARDAQPIAIQLDHSFVIECANDYGHCGQYVRRASDVPYSPSLVPVPEWLSESLVSCGPAALMPVRIRDVLPTTPTVHGTFAVSRLSIECAGLGARPHASPPVPSHVRSWNFLWPHWRVC